MLCCGSSALASEPIGPITCLAACNHTLLDVNDLTYYRPGMAGRNGFPEDPVERAERRVRSAQERVARQREMVTTLTGSGDVRRALRAREQLRILERNLRLARQYLEHVRRQRDQGK